jgi:hypothetical protein
MLECSKIKLARISIIFGIRKNYKASDKIKLFISQWIDEKLSHFNYFIVLSLKSISFR